MKSDGESRVRECLIGAGLRVERFGKTEIGRGRTPDFRVFSNGDLAFYCEVKTAQEDEFTLGVGLRPDSTYNRITKHIHSAVGQFDAVNPSIDHPNVLAIVNGDDDAGFTDLIQVLTGNAYGESGEVNPMFHGYSEGRIREEKLRVHVYLWFNEWKRGGPQMFFPEVHAAHHSSLCRYLNVDATAMKHLPA